MQPRVRDLGEHPGSSQRAASNKAFTGRAGRQAGLLKRRMYTYRWVSLLVWLYFTEGVVRAWSDPAPGNWLAGLEIVLCLLLFTACALHVRHAWVTLLASTAME